MSALIEMEQSNNQANKWFTLEKNENHNLVVSASHIGFRPSRYLSHHIKPIIKIDI